MIRQLNFNGNPFVGVFSFTNNSITIVREDIEQHKDVLKETLGTEVILSTIAATDLAGIYVAGNNNGIVLPYVIEEEELQLIEDLELNKCILDVKETAVGNLILSNDKGAIISPILSNEQKIIEDVLGVETAVSSIGNHKYVGSVARTNNTGCLVHKEAKEDDIALIKDILKVDLKMATLNRGVSYIGACIVVNDKGAVVGEATTGIEISYIEDIMGIWGEIMIKTYTVEGVINLRSSTKHFIKDFQGVKEEDVLEDIYSRYGSIYGCKRRNIEIKSIVEKQGEM